MFNSARLNSRLIAAALGALTIEAIAFSTSAAAAPLPLFPFIFSPPVQSAPPQAALAPYDDEGTVTELPARLKRQIVSYPTREAPGTIIIDTPNTYLYYVLGGGQAIRYGIGVGRDGFTWSGTQTIVKKAEWPDWTPPPEMIARQPYLPRQLAGPPGKAPPAALSAPPDARRPRQSARRPRHVPRRHHLSHPRHQRAAHHRHS